MPNKRQALATILLATAAVLAHAQEDAKKEPKTGTNYVPFLSSAMPARGQVRMIFRNICASAFQIRVEARGNIRESGIEAGSPEKPSRAFVLCKTDERCEVAKWQY